MREPPDSSIRLLMHTTLGVCDMSSPFDSDLSEVAVHVRETLDSWIL